MRKIESLDVSKAIKRLKRIYPTPIPRDELVPIWLDVLGSMSVDAFRFAVRRFEESEADYFPKPGKILALSKRFVSPVSLPKKSFQDDYKEWCLVGYSGPCPVCGAEWGRLETPVDDFAPLPPLTHGVVHIAESHEALGVPLLWHETPGHLRHDGFSK